jgi:hypothetical protein
VLLKLFQKLHRFPNLDEIAASVVDHLRIQLGLGAAVLFEYDDPVQRARQRHAIREYKGFMAWSKQEQPLIRRTRIRIFPYTDRRVDWK